MQASWGVLHAPLGRVAVAHMAPVGVDILLAWSHDIARTAVNQLAQVVSSELKMYNGYTVSE